MTAFGPYANTQVVDFRVLGDRSFFLVHGATGAGKTTILDAICFALYGETSGNERKGEQMRSHHTKSSIPTEVTFDFELGSEIYRITRSLKRDLVKEADGQAAFKPDKATLWKCSDTANAGDAWIEIESKWTKVTKVVESLFGFASDQFRQVIILPQDKFQQLLKANSHEREELFKILFRTAQFERIEEALKEEAKRLEDELKGIIKQREWILSGAQISSQDELADKRRVVFGSLQAMHDKLVNLRATEQRAAERWSQGKETDRIIIECEQAETGLLKIEARQAEFSEKRRSLERARRAAVLAELEKVVSSQQLKADDAEAKSAAALKDHGKVVEAQQRAAATLAHEMQRQTERDDARREQERLQSLHERVEQLDAARLRLQFLQTQEDKAAREHANTKKRRDELRRQLSQLELDLGQSARIAVQIISAQQSEANASQVHDQWIKLRNIAQQWKAAQDKEAETQQRLQDLDDRLVQARGKRDALETAWYEGQAAILARQLTDSMPCPVCGATHHPRPAVSDQAPPSETELKYARAAVTALEAQRQEAHTEWTQCHDDVVRYDAERRPLVESLGEKARLPLKQIEAELKTAKEEMLTAQQEERRMAQLKQHIEPLKEELAQAEARLAEVERAWQEAVNQRTAAQAIFSERYGGVPPELDDLQKLQIAKQKVDEIIEQLARALQQAEEKDERAKKQLAASEATLKQLSEQAVVEHQRADESKKQFIERAEAEGFADLDDYHRAKLQPQDIAHLDNEIRTYEGQLQASREYADRAREAAKSLVKPDLTALQVEYQRAREAADAALQAERDLASELKACDEWLEQLGQLQDKFTKKTEEFSVIGSIAEVANGRNAHNITFQRFVLSALLEDVLSYATQRLQIMSRSRYLLQRAQSPLDKRRASGLDLVVSDTWTGDSKRPVETLSGGEGFYTALALALGLAEVVQAYAGGIRLDTIFVDEGFGSLDSDTLDLAIRTLENLKEGGRLVGIISHVESLRERISARLEVTAGVNGSTAKFVVG